jgi:hypothetical protein
LPNPALHQFPTALTRLWGRPAGGQAVQPENDFVAACLGALPTNRTSVFVAC